MLGSSSELGQGKLPEFGGIQRANKSLSGQSVENKRRKWAQGVRRWWGQNLQCREGGQEVLGIYSPMLGSHCELGGWPDLVSKAVDKVKDSLGNPYRQGWRGGDSSHFLSPHHETGSPVSCLLCKVWNHLSSIQCNPPLQAQSLQAPWKGD